MKNTNRSQPPSLRPDTVLYIYYIEGVFPIRQHIDEPTFIGNWVEDNFSFLFFTSPVLSLVERLVAELSGLILLDEYTMTYGQWQGGAIEPVRIGRFLLNPPWIKATPAEHEIDISLDSGVVFGNGAHTTTQACLEAIEIACAGKTPQSVLDLGCGTGILALAAAKLGCTKVLAIDYNHLAAQTTNWNVSLNDLEDKIIVINGKAQEHMEKPSDLLIANIHYDVMKDIVMSDSFLRHKWFVLSGMLQRDVDKVTQYLKTRPVHLLKRWNQDGIWHTLLGITAQDS